MPHVNVFTRSGDEHRIEATPGLSVMEIIRDGGLDELLALCGGCCSCATCHVHVDEDWLPKLAPMNSDEDDLLDGSDHRRQSSRLSCQICFTPEFDGLSVTIAAED